MVIRFRVAVAWAKGLISARLGSVLSQENPSLSHHYPSNRSHPPQQAVHLLGQRTTATGDVRVAAARPTRS